MKHRMCIPLFAALLLGCASGPVPPHNSNALWHLQVGRDYAAQGRYELAKEHLLKALASNSDPNLRGRLAHELQSVDTMLETQR